MAGNSGDERGSTRRASPGAAGRDFATSSYSRWMTCVPGYHPTCVSSFHPSWPMQAFRWPGWRFQVGQGQRHPPLAVPSRQYPPQTRLVAQPGPQRILSFPPGHLCLFLMRGKREIDVSDARDGVETEREQDGRNRNPGRKWKKNISHQRIPTGWLFFLRFAGLLSLLLLSCFRCRIRGSSRLGLSVGSALLGSRGGGGRILSHDAQRSYRREQ